MLPGLSWSSRGDNMSGFVPSNKWIILYYTVLTVITYALFAIDKKRAIRKKRRIQELTLFVFSLLGGAPGGVLAMIIYHHKTRKPYFAVTLPILTIIHAALFVYLTKPDLFAEITTAFLH